MSLFELDFVDSRKIGHEAHHRWYRRRYFYFVVVAVYVNFVSNVRQNHDFDLPTTFYYKPVFSYNRFVPDFNFDSVCFWGR